MGHLAGPHLAWLCALCGCLSALSTPDHFCQEMLGWCHSTMPRHTPSIDDGGRKSSSALTKRPDGGWVLYRHQPTASGQRSLGSAQVQGGHGEGEWRATAELCPSPQLPALPQPMKMHQDSLEEQQEKEVDADPVYEEVGNFPELAALDLGRGLLSDLSALPSVDRSKKPASFTEQAPATALRSSLPASPVKRVEGPSVTKALSLERGLNLESDKAPAQGLRPTKTASLERNMELDWERAATPGSSASTETSLEVSRKRSLQPPSPINDKLIQELSSVILRKTEGQPPGPGQPVT